MSVSVTPLSELAPPGKSTALVFVNGQVDESTLHRCRDFATALQVCVDGGLRHCIALGFVPDLLIGDLDSVQTADVAELERNETVIVRHPVDKDATDLELTLATLAGARLPGNRHVGGAAGDLLADKAVTQVILVGVAGGRLDQTLANLMLLGSRSWPFQVDFIDSNGDGTLVTSSNPLHRQCGAGRTISLLALSEEVTGVTTSGLQYALQGATLVPGSTLGVSNVSTHDQVSVTVTTGRLLSLLNHKDN